MQPDASIVGRDGELGVLRGALRDAAAGRGRLALIAGEPGIGKTRIATELAATAAMQGFVALWARCPDAAGAPAFWPFRQIAREYRRQARSGGDLAKLERHLAATATHDDGVPEQARFALFERVASALRAAAEEAPLLLIIDDLHWADRSSVKLLCFVAREIATARIAIVGTLREIEPTTPAEVEALLGDLATLGITVPVRGLGRDDVARLIAAESGTTPDPRVVARIHDATQGNPLFVGEVVRLLAAEHRLAGADATLAALPIPLGVRAAITRRSEALDADARAVLAAAAVCGREFALGVLERAVDLPSALVRTSVEKAERLGLLARCGSRHSRFAFGHALMREALYEELPAARRAELHRRIAATLEEVHANDLEPHLAELADHFRTAGDAASLERAVTYAQRAGESAQRMLAYEEAERQLASALETLEQCPGAAAARRREILVALAEAQRGCGHVDEMHASFRQAVELARGLDVPTFASTVLRYSGARTEFSFVDETMVALLEEAIASLPDAPSTLRARLMARLASSLLLSPSAETRRATLAAEAERMARALGDKATLAWVLAMRVTALVGPDNVQERLALAGEILRLADESDFAVAALEAQTGRVHDLLELGDIHASDLAIDAFARRANALQQPLYLWHLATWRTMRALLDGRLDEAETLAGEAFAAGQRASQATAMMHYGQQLLAIRFEQGRMRELEGLIRMAVEQAPTVAAWRIELLSVELENERFVEAQAMLDSLAAHEFTDLPRDTNWLMSLVSLAFGASELGDAVRAQRLHALLRPYAGRFVVTRPAVCFFGGVSYYLGRLARTAGQRDLAAEHFARALREHTQLGARIWTARAEADYASLLAERGRAEDEAPATQLAERAVAAAEELRLIELQPRARRALAAVQARTTSEGWHEVEEAPLALVVGGRNDSAPTGRSSGATVVDIAQRRAGTERNGYVAASRGSAPRPARVEPAYEMRREGAIWTVVFDGRTVRERQSIGLGYIAYLLSRPDLDVTTWELAALDGTPASAPLDGALDAGSDLRVASAPGHALEAGDGRAVAEYRARLTELREEAEGARRANDLGRLASIDAELRFVEDELTGMVGLGSRARLTGSPAERTRVRVTKAIRYAIRKLAAHDARLGEHLDASIKTGTLCSYAPRPRLASGWSIS
ncbi:MAG: AAA family ATPase [Candidatus Binatia bacterium]